MSKQDRQGARTLAELMRKYNFGRAFAEFLGIATDARDTAKKASEAVGELDQNLTADEIFLRLTNNGTLQGLYRGDDGELYTNATYIRSGKIASDIIDGSTLNIKDGATIGAWNIVNNAITSATAADGEGAVDTVWLEPTRVVFLRNQDAGDYMIASWERIADVCRDGGELDALEERVAALEEALRGDGT